MSRSRKLLPILVSAATAGAAVLAVAPRGLAQPAAGAFDDLIDFVLRGSEDEEDIWSWENEPGPSMLETEIGPPLLPLLGPNGEEPIGPELAGPDAPADLRERLTAQEEEGDPFAALGVKLGPFMIRPSIEIGVTATNNIEGVEDATAAVGLVVAPEVIVSHEGARSAWELSVGAEAIAYDPDVYDTQSVTVRNTWSYDLTSTTTLTGDGGYARFRENFSDDSTPGAAAERPTVDAYDATLGVEQHFGRLIVNPSGFVERSVHDDVPLIGGGVASRRELDNTEYGGRLRTGVDLGSVTPFTEVAGGRRDYDQEVDDSGFERSSLWGELIGGLIIDRGDKLSGEVSVGYHHEELEDGSLPDIDALLLNAAVVWSPRRLTEVRVDLFTDTLTSSTAGESGSVLYSGLITVSRRVTPRLLLAVGGGMDHERSVGGDWRDLTFTGFAEASYAFNRIASLTGRYEYERVESSEPGSDSKAHTVGVRLRLQR